MNRRLAHLISTFAFGALALGASACVIRESPGVNGGYGYGYQRPGYQASVQFGQPSPTYVQSLPPDPLYESMTTSPGDGYVWIDGSWQWNGYEWVWDSGSWVNDQPGYVYVQPYWDYDDSGRYEYYNGYWSRPEQVPTRARVIDHRDGRPPTGYYPPPTQRPPVGEHGHGPVIQPPDRHPVPQPQPVPLPVPPRHHGPTPSPQPQPQQYPTNHQLPPPPPHTTPSPQPQPEEPPRHHGPQPQPEQPPPQQTRPEPPPQEHRGPQGNVRQPAPERPTNHPAPPQHSAPPPATHSAPPPRGNTTRHHAMLEGTPSTRVASADSSLIAGTSMRRLTGR